jgi:hypothetical protein
VQDRVADRLEHRPAGVGGDPGFVSALLPFELSGQDHVDVVRAELVQPEFEVRTETHVADRDRPEVGDPELGVKALGWLQDVDEIGVEVLGEHHPGLIQVRAAQCDRAAPVIGIVPGHTASPRRYYIPNADGGSRSV